MGEAQAHLPTADPILFHELPGCADLFGRLGHLLGRFPAVQSGRTSLEPVKGNPVIFRGVLQYMILHSSIEE